MLCWRIGQFLREVKLLWYLTSFNYSRSPNASWDHLQKSRTASFLAESPDPPCEHNVWPRAKLSRLFGKSTKLWRNISPKVKLCRLLGQFTFSSFWLKLWPSVMIWRLLGKVTSCRRCLKSWPKVKLSRPIWPEEIWIILPYVVFSMIFGLFIHFKIAQLIGRNAFLLSAESMIGDSQFGGCDWTQHQKSSFPDCAEGCANMPHLFQLSGL